MAHLKGIKQLMFITAANIKGGNLNPNNIVLFANNQGTRPIVKRLKIRV